MNASIYPETTSTVLSDLLILVDKQYGQKEVPLFFPSGKLPLYSILTNFLPQEVWQLPLQEEKFLHQATTVIGRHLSDESFHIGSFSKEMALSRSQLHRRIVGITGQSATAFIRMIRLLAAARLLAKPCANVTEVAMEVGFFNLPYFTRCFKKMYGVPPSRFWRLIEVEARRLES